MDRDRAPLVESRPAFSIRNLSLLVPLVFLGVFVVWPLVAVLQRSLIGVDLDRVAEILTRASTRRILWFTFWQALASTGLTLLVGLPIAHALSRYRFPGRSVIRSIAVVPFVLPTVVVAAAFNSLFEQADTVFDQTMFGQSVFEQITSQRSLLAILGAHVFFNVAIIIRVVGGFWQGMDGSLEEAAQVLGAKPLAAFRRVTLPRLAPVILGASLLVFLFSFTSFGVILILGGPKRATVETEIYRYAISRGELDVAALLALIQLGIVIALATASARFQRSYAKASTGRSKPVPLTVNTMNRRLHLGLVVFLVMVVIGLPIASLVGRSLQVGDGYGLANYTNLAEPVSLLPTTSVLALLTSLKFALMAAVVASLIGLISAFGIVRGGRMGRLVEAASLVPLGISAVTLGLGYLLAFTVFDFRRSIWLVPLAHAVMGLPFVLASVVPAMRSIDDRLRQVAATLGASPTRVGLGVVWPLVRRPLMTGAGFAAAISMGEFGATSFVARGKGSFTAPLAIFRLLSQPGELIRGQAIALSVVVGVMVAVIAAVLERQRGQGVQIL